MRQYYKVFNPITGLREDAESWDKAVATRVKIQQDFIQFHQAIFTIAEVTVNDDGTETWRNPEYVESNTTST
jgi:hypothetical protein